MSLLYEEVYRKKQAQYKLDGDLTSFNQFINLAQEYQFQLIKKEVSESSYAEWLLSQMENC